MLCHPEVPVGALPWSGDRISCSCWSTGQSCPMTVHHLPAQLHLSIWTECCWLLCHHLLPGTSLFSVKRRSSSLRGKLGSWSRSPTWKKADGKMSGLSELLGNAPSPPSCCSEAEHFLDTASCCIQGPLTFSFCFPCLPKMNFSPHWYLITKTPGSLSLDSYGSGGNSKGSLSISFMRNPWHVWQEQTRHPGGQPEVAPAAGPGLGPGSG